MRRPALTDEELFSVLLGDKDTFGIFVLMPFSGVSSIEELERFNDNLWFHVHAQLAHTMAERMLNPVWRGPLITRAYVIECVAAAAKLFGAFHLPDADEMIPEIVAEPYVAFALSLHTVVDCSQTARMRWQRVTVICNIAKSFHITPLDFLTQIPDAHDWLLRVTSSPDELRKAELQRLDALHPDRVTRRIADLRRSLTQRVEGHYVEVVSQILGLNMAVGEAGYWEMRAAHLQRIEERIAHVWPGAALGATPAPPDDA